MAKICDEWGQNEQVDSHHELLVARSKYGKPFKYVFTNEINEEQSVEQFQNSFVEDMSDLISIISDFFGDHDPIHLSRDLIADFQLGARIHVNNSLVIHKGWKDHNQNRNFEISYISFKDGLPETVSLQSESSLIAASAMHEEYEAKRVQRQHIEIKKKEAKLLLFEQNISFDRNTLEDILSTFSRRQSSKAMGELTAYVNRIPGRFPAQVGNYVSEGKAFQVAVQEATEFLIKAAKNKGIYYSMLRRIKKDCEKNENIE
ncbi:hypothetical protein UNDYM_5949 (plasmid) [Undibacterium sp. YM2]|nr:hypothetical protein UNDYM_5949 [Undibacterium sp. YM2]